MSQRRSALDAVLARSRIIPVLTIERVDDAVPLARSLVAGGVPVLEVTLRTPVGLDAAVAIMAAVPEAVVGIGTVLTPDDLGRAVSIGAKFALSPGATPALLAAAAQYTIPFMPGIATASELMVAMQHGFDTVKFFPANTAGGQAALRGLAGPVSGCALLPDRWNRRRQCCSVADAPQCGSRRRLLANPRHRVARRRMGDDHPACRPGGRRSRGMTSSDRVDLADCLRTPLQYCRAP